MNETPRRGGAEIVDGLHSDLSGRVIGCRGRPVGEGRIDLIVERRMVVELKAVEKLLPLREEQVLSYLKVTDHRIGLLINFNVEVLRHEVRRIVHHFVE